MTEADHTAITKIHALLWYCVGQPCPGKSCLCYAPLLFSVITVAPYLYGQQYGHSVSAARHL